MPGFELLWRMQVAAHSQPLSPVRHEMALGQEWREEVLWPTSRIASSIVAWLRGCAARRCPELRWLVAGQCSED
ncbi:hypothetical protein NEUTE2DRAFT_53852 [Neurospora tetrasperma FGSC 2509]|nr:hypothetical protein NEUTE2DRAFT_53852 [Neurospora tetrasperma FGSC 2509]